MNLGGEVTVNTVFSGATLLSLAGFIWKWATWKSTLDTERKAEKEARDLERDSTAKAFGDIKTTLGNGAPGTVVRTVHCEALHDKVASEIQAVSKNVDVVRDDIRELRDLVIGQSR